MTVTVLPSFDWRKSLKKKILADSFSSLFLVIKSARATRAQGMKKVFN